MHVLHECRPARWIAPTLVKSRPVSTNIYTPSKHTQPFLITPKYTRYYQIISSNQIVSHKMSRREN